MRTLPAALFGLALLTLTAPLATAMPEPEDLSPFASAGATCRPVTTSTRQCAAVQVYATTTCEPFGPCWGTFAADLEITSGACVSLTDQMYDMDGDLRETYQVWSIHSTCYTGDPTRVMMLHREWGYQPPFFYPIGGYNFHHVFTLCVGSAADTNAPRACTSWQHLALGPDL